jgi:hypothetical protein
MDRRGERVNSAAPDMVHGWFPAAQMSRGG